MQSGIKYISNHCLIFDMYCFIYFHSRTVSRMNELIEELERLILISIKQKMFSVIKCTFINSFQYIVTYILTYINILFHDMLSVFAVIFCMYNVYVFYMYKS